MDCVMQQKQHAAEERGWRRMITAGEHDGEARPGGLRAACIAQTGSMRVV